ncbi:MAG TPA: PilZ domain-containing protein [Dissulfurispiraceae bacterium]
MENYELRREKRVPIHLEANILSGDRVYAGNITNVSEHGVGYFITRLELVSDDFAPEKLVELSFPGHSGGHLTMHCEIRWFIWDEWTGEAALGMRIMDSYPLYRQFLDALKDQTELLPA